MGDAAPLRKQSRDVKEFRVLILKFHLVVLQTSPDETLVPLTDCPTCKGLKLITSLNQNSALGWRCGIFAKPPSIDLKHFRHASLDPVTRRLLIIKGLRNFLSNL
jgi:hypothetical protein